MCPELAACGSLPLGDGAYPGAGGGCPATADAGSAGAFTGAPLVHPQSRCASTSRRSVDTNARSASALSRLKPGFESRWGRHPEIAHRRLFTRFRKTLKDKFGIKVTREIHASEFIRNCSDNISDRKLNLGLRKHAFELCVRQLADMKQYIRIINVCLSVPQHTADFVHFRAVERLLNRINRTMEKVDSHAIVIFDSGKEREIEKLVRKMAVFNPIPSQFGAAWPDGAAYRNITIERVIEDPVFRPSHRSLLLQCADHAAFTLLKRETPPTKFVKQWGYHRLFQILKPVCFLNASPRDPEGIVR